MGKKNKSYRLNVAKKNRFKVFRTILQFVVLFFASMFIITSIVSISVYKEPDKSTWTNTNGFVALTYFGVSRQGSSKLVPKSELQKQLRILSEMGYVTVSQQDIVDFYEKGAPLPQKALFLGFEDGRSDSSLFAQSIMEKYNLKATIFSYANKVDGKDNKFLSTENFLDLTKNGYWELGTNGYRLSYINIIDKDGNFLGMRNEGEFDGIDTAKDYNHYLMDFIRDADGIPTEDRQQMAERISADYDKMSEIYQTGLGYVPGAYIIMHSNELYTDMNNLVQSANEEEIKKLFKMNFNRNLSCYNTADESIYDLNRLQVGAYWHTNHLLMALERDTGEQSDFVSSDDSRAADWNVVSGAAEFSGNDIIFTSPAKKNGIMVLKSGQNYDNISLSVTLDGEVVGTQSVYLRYTDNEDSYIRIRSSNNQIIVEQKRPGKVPDTLYTYNMALPEYEKQNGPSALQEAFLYNQDGTINEYAPQPYLLGLSKTTNLGVTISEQTLSLTVDGVAVKNNISIDPSIGSGMIALGAQRSRLNEKDDIYDAVFSDLRVSAAGGQGDPLYENTYKLFDKIVDWIKNLLDSMVNWTMDTF